MPGLTSGPVVHSKDQIVSGVGRAGGNCARGSDEREECEERKAQQGAATDSGGVGEDISEFHGVARRHGAACLHVL